MTMIPQNMTMHVMTRIGKVMMSFIAGLQSIVGFEKYSVYHGRQNFHHLILKFL